MKIAVFNLKGGVGKTSIALNLAFSIKCGVITNDSYTIIEEVLPNKAYLVVENDQDFPELEQDNDIIYDFGGYIDKRITKILKNVDLVIIPIINDEINIKSSLSTVLETIKINKKILIIANIAEKNDGERLKNIIKTYVGIELPVLSIKRTNAFRKVVKRKESIEEIANSNPLLKFSYKEVTEQFKEIIKFINNTKEYGYSY